LSTADVHEAYAAVPGPVDRESFFTAQARNRRTAWRLTALCVLAIVILGIPLSTILGPLFYGVAALAVDLANLFTPLPDPVHWFFNDFHPVPAFPDSSLWGYVIFAIVLAPPGALFLLPVWLGSRALFLRSGAGGILLTLGAREPKTGDLEERQLVNLVAEMAIAAGVPPPRVLLLDTRAVNAAVVGSSLADGAVVVSRGLLDALDRDETQGVIGHLVGSIANGDLRIAMTMLSLYQTLGVVVAALSSPFSPPARVALRRLVRFALQRREGEEAAEAEAVTQLLAGGLDGRELEVDDFEKQGWIGKVKSIAALPFLAAYTAFWMNQKILGGFVVAPPLTFAWKARRHLADSTAVQLTRNPDGLARALLRLSREDAAIPQAAWASHLFVAWPGNKGTLGDKVGTFGSFQPKIEHRLRRLRAMGSTVSPPPPPRRRGGVKDGFQGMTPLAWVLASPFILAFAGLMIAAALATVGISLAIDGLFFFGLFVMPLHLLLRYLAR
jgi:Zn-dependent protease with chaperone function